MVHRLRRVVVRVTMLIFLLSGPCIWEAIAVPLADVSFSDPNLQACVQRMAQTRGWANTEEVTSLMCNNAGIVSIIGLEALVNLGRLNLGDNLIGLIDNLTPLAGLTNLTVVLLDRNFIADLSPLAGLTNLTTLDVSFNDITDPTPIAGLTNFTTLDVSSNSITDLNIPLEFSREKNDLITNFVVTLLFE